MQAGEQVKVPAVCAITAVEMLTHRPPPSKARRGVQPLCGLGGGGGGWLGEAFPPGREAYTDGTPSPVRGRCIALNTAKFLVTECFRGKNKRQARAGWAAACAGKVKKCFGEKPT